MSEYFPESALEPMFPHLRNLLASQGVALDGIYYCPHCAQGRLGKNAGTRLHSLAGTASLGQFAAVMSLAAVVLTNNTGPAHLAAALGMPVVDLYALTNPQHTPWKTPSRVLFHDVPCRFCYKSVCPQGHQHCLALVEPARVVNAAHDLLQARIAGLPPDAGEDKALLAFWPG